MKQNRVLHKNWVQIAILYPGKAFNDEWKQIKHIFRQLLKKLASLMYPFSENIERDTPATWRIKQKKAREAGNRRFKIVGRHPKGILLYPESKNFRVLQREKITNYPIYLTIQKTILRGYWKYEKPHKYLENKASENKDNWSFQGKSNYIRRKI